MCDIEGKLNEWIKLFKNALKGHHTLFIIDDCSVEGEINKKRDALSELAFSGRHRNHSLWVLTLYGMGGVESTPPGSFLLITLKRLNGFE